MIENQINVVNDREGSTNVQKDKGYQFISNFNECNCLEFSNNQTIQILTKKIIYRRGFLNAKFDNIKQDQRFKNYDVNRLYQIFLNVVKVLERRKLKQFLTKEEKNYIYHITLNNLNENGKLNKNELFKIIKTKLFLDTPKFDSEIFKIINSVKERNIELKGFSVPKYLLPKKSGMYLIERKNEFILSLGPKYLNIGSHVLFYNKMKIFGIGFINSIYKEGIISNTYKILPILLVTNDNMVHMENINECEYPVKNVPFCVISYEESENIFKQFTSTADFISLGARLIGDKVLKKTSDSILWYDLSYESLLEMFEKRLIILGPPSAGKSILGVQLLRFLGNKKRKVIAIAPSNPNLAKFGLPLKSIGKNNPNWDLDNISLEYMNKYKSDKLDNFCQIVLGEHHYMPDIEKLSKKTILSLINEVTGSIQMKNIIALELVNHSIIEVLQMAHNETLIKEEDFQQNQIKALKRVATILLKWQNIGTKTNLKESIYSNDNPLGFHIDSELFLPELVFILMAEVFYNAKPCFDIKSEGLFLMVDEIPLLMNSEGVLIKGQDLGRIFKQINKQGRNMGILLGCIIQSYSKKIQTQFLPQSLEEYHTLHLDVKNKKRIIKLNNEYILVPPVSNI